MIVYELEKSSWGMHSNPGQTEFHKTFSSLKKAKAYGKKEYKVDKWWQNPDSKQWSFEGPVYVTINKVAVA